MAFERLGATGDSLRIKNNEWYIGRNYEQNGDVKVFRINTANQIEFFSVPNVNGDTFALQSQVDNLQQQVDYILQIIGSITAGNINIVPVTMTAGQIAAKALTLPQAPLSGKTMIIPANGIPQLCDVDFTVSGSTLLWNGQPFEQVVAEGDKVKVIYMF